MASTSTSGRRHACFDCGKQLHLEHKTVPCPETGLDNIRLANVPVWTCPNGHEEVEIPAFEELLELLSDIVIRKPGPLLGKEVRFLRKRMGMNARLFADRLGMTAVHISRLENGRRPLPRRVDLLIRLYAAHSLAQRRHTPCPPELTAILEQLEALETPSPEHELRYRKARKAQHRAEWVEATVPCSAG